MNMDKKAFTILLTTVGGFIAMLALLPPLAQDPVYHEFADQRSMLGMDHFWNVLSNFLFLVIGVWGMFQTLKMKQTQGFKNSLDHIPFLIFFSGVFLVALGSGYYHEAPDNMRLIWDRLPMTIAFMAFLSLFVVDRIHSRVGVLIILPLGIICGAGSIIYWVWSEQNGVGDLRPYAFIQFFPIILLPVLCWLYPNATYTKNHYLLQVFIWYGGAKVLEHFDSQIYEFFNQAISGHSLKHFSAAFATLVVIKMMKKAV